MDSGESTLDSGKLGLFVVAPPQDCFCPVCTELLTEPLLSDCGHHVCRECHERIMASDHAECPTCQELDVLKTARLNKRLQREVYDHKVHCQNKTGNKRGCQWIGELREIEDHLNLANILSISNSNKATICSDRESHCMMSLVFSPIQ